MAKAQKQSDDSKETTSDNADAGLQNFYFPLQDRTIRATSYEAAKEALEEQLEKEKAEGNEGSKGNGEGQAE